MAVNSMRHGFLCNNNQQLKYKFGFSECSADDTSATPKTVFFNAKLSGHVTYEALRVVVFDKVHLSCNH